MASKIVVSQIPPYDGEYEFDDRMFSTFELRWIKQIAGYLPLTIDEGLKGGDADLICALTVIAMNRAGRIGKDEVLAVADVLADVPFDGARIAFIGEEEEASPPASTSEPEEPLQSGSLDSRKSSGADSPNGSEKLEETLAPTGITRLPTSPISVPETLGT